MKVQVEGSGAVIGPNAILQLAAVLSERHGEAGLRRVFRRAGLVHYLADPPTAMVLEREVMRLHVALAACLGPFEAEAAAAEAGRRTAAYILANRIPAPAHRLLRLLPAGLAAPLLLAAIRRHAWTFAGSARFAVRSGSRPVVELSGCSLCRTGLAGGRLPAFYAATFEGLFASLVRRGARVLTLPEGAPVTWRAVIRW